MRCRSGGASGNVFGRPRMAWVPTGCNTEAQRLARSHSVFVLSVACRGPIAKPGPAQLGSATIPPGLLLALRKSKELRLDNHKVYQSTTTLVRAILEVAYLSTATRRPSQPLCPRHDAAALCHSMGVTWQECPAATGR